MENKKNSPGIAYAEPEDCFSKELRKKSTVDFFDVRYLCFLLA